MMKQFLGAAIVLNLTVLCLTVSLVHGEPKGGRGGKPPERKPEGRQGGEQPHNRPPAEGNREGNRGGNPNAKQTPGGSWSERTHSGALGSEHAGGERAGAENGQPGAKAGFAAGKHNEPQASGAQGAAAGAAAANRNDPKATGAQGAAAGAAVANRNNPQATGAQGAALGAAAANRNNPQLTGAQGAAVGAAVANNNGPQATSAAGAAAGYSAVRNSVDHPNIYGQQWFGSHPGAWIAPGLAAGAAWAPASWGAVAGQCGYANQPPVSYNYGVNVTCPDGNVMIDGQNVGTAADFSQQAADLAQLGASAQLSDNEQWMPLGVFALVRNDQDHPQLILQMAINKQGILRGNYTDEVTDHTLPIQGAVDKATARAAWTVGANPSNVMEAGLSNLTQNEAPTLIHKNGKTQHWILVRLEQPAP